MKSSTLRAGVALACALSLSACGGGDGNLPLTGSISGVTKDGLVLTNTNGDSVAIPANAVSFQFPKLLSTDDEFTIGYSSLPLNSDGCQIFNGHARANYYTISQVQVVCTIKLVPLTVQITGLTADGLKLVNGSDQETVAAGTSTFNMAKVYQDGTYAVKVLNQPTGQTCTVSGGDSGNGSGTAGAGGITNVVVSCRAGT